MGIIRLNKMLFYGYHGVDELEQNRGGTFEVDLEMKTVLAKASHTDSLKDTIDYSAVYNTVHDCLTSTKHYLLESLAGHVANTILAEFDVSWVKVNVRKPQAPVKGVLESVEVEIERSRD